MYWSSTAKSLKLSSLWIVIQKKSSRQIYTLPYTLPCQSTKCSDRKIQINWIKHADKFNLAKLRKIYLVCNRTMLHKPFINWESGEEQKLNLLIFEALTMLQQLMLTLNHGRILDKASLIALCKNLLRSSHFRSHWIKVSKRFNIKSTNPLHF